MIKDFIFDHFMVIFISIAVISFIWNTIRVASGGQPYRPTQDELDRLDEDGRIFRNNAAEIEHRYGDPLDDHRR